MLCETLCKLSTDSRCRGSRSMQDHTSDQSNKSAAQTRPWLQNLFALSKFQSSNSFARDNISTSGSQLPLTCGCTPQLPTPASLKSVQKATATPLLAHALIPQRSQVSPF